MGAPRHGPVGLLRRMPSKSSRSPSPGTPLILAFETATKVSSVALLRGETLIAERAAPVGVDASLTLLSMVDELLEGDSSRLDGVDAFAVSIGPGSFTGLRIGLATLKGLAFARQGCAVAVSTLEALAEGALEGAQEEGGKMEGMPVVPLLDARRGEVYAAAFERKGSEWQTRVPEGVYRPEELATRIPTRCLLVGEGAALCHAVLRESLGDAIAIAAGPGYPRARFVGALAARALARGDGCDAADLIPRYLRRAEAEVKRTGVRFEAREA